MCLLLADAIGFYLCRASDLCRLNGCPFYWCSEHAYKWLASLVVAGANWYQCLKATGKLQCCWPSDQRLAHVNQVYSCWGAYGVNWLKYTYIYTILKNFMLIFFSSFPWFRCYLEKEQINHLQLWFDRLGVEPGRGIFTCAVCILTALLDCPNKLDF